MLFRSHLVDDGQIELIQDHRLSNVRGQFGVSEHRRHLARSPAFVRWLEALGAAAIDFGAVGDTPPVFAQAGGANLVYLAALPGSPHAVLVPNDSPIRTLADLRGKKIKEGDGLTLFYWSGNRDEEVFEEPFKFKVDRNVSKHVAFGYGVHVCLGMHLARMEIKALFNELLPRLKSIELNGTPKNTLANFVSGLKTLPVRYQMA